MSRSTKKGPFVDEKLMKKISKAKSQGVSNTVINTWLIMTVKAKTKNIGISAKKIRPLVNLLRGKKAVDAVSILSFMPSNSSEVLLELIKSAIANAESMQYGTKDELVISTIYADKSTSMRRWRARARGRAGTFDRPQSHIFVELTDNTIQEEN